MGQILQITNEFQEDINFQRKAFKETKNADLFENNIELIKDEFLEVKQPLSEEFLKVENEIMELKSDSERHLEEVRKKFLLRQNEMMNKFKLKKLRRKVSR